LVPSLLLANRHRGAACMLRRYPPENSRLLVCQWGQWRYLRYLLFPRKPCDYSCTGKRIQHQPENFFGTIPRHKFHGSKVGKRRPILSIDLERCRYRSRKPICRSSFKLISINSPLVHGEKFLGRPPSVPQHSLHPEPVRNERRRLSPCLV